ncbi:MAG: isochorismatase family protein [Armatimonadetes bacterium]|nr:isochorismatase family protein [Armatimonadota bacterium]MDE2206833.1 isochorismatase family protein [Armatimonadota bacterium]
MTEPVRAKGLLGAAGTVLVVVDMQAPFLAPIFERERVEANVQLLLQSLPLFGVPVMATTQYQARMGDTIPALKELLPPETPVLDKLAFSCAGNPQFTATLAAMSRRQILLCGIETHICVSQTAHDLLALGYEVHVAGDAVSSRAKLNWRLGLQKMAASGAVITSAEAAVYEVMERAGTPEFKRVIPFVK